MMLIENFYSTSATNAVVITLITHDEWQNCNLKLTKAEKNYLNINQFQGKSSDLCIIYNEDGNITKVFLGTGPNNKALALSYAATHLPIGIYRIEEESDLHNLLAWGLAQYHFNFYKKNHHLPRVLLITAELITTIAQFGSAIFLVRNLINQPANILNTEELANTTAKLAKDYHASFTQWQGEELLEKNFPAIYTVGKGSKNTPRLLSLHWGNKQDPYIILIGKGVCFDSGGLNLKSANGMRYMKKDMGGAAHVLGLAHLIMSQKLPLRLQVLIPAVENAIGGNAFRPGDIITMRNGLTVEIDNTDAEGRLILADALTKASEEEPQLIIDFSTLTGAARVALGTDIAVMFSNDDHIAQLLQKSALQTNDLLWRLPLHEGYASQLDSTIADLTNCSNSPYGGAITAALFLQHFVKPQIPWVHFDIMAWNLHSKPGRPEGGEAMGLRAVANFLKQKFCTSIKPM